MTAGGDEWGGYIEEPDEDETDAVRRGSDEVTAPSGVPPAPPPDDPTAVRRGGLPDDTTAPSPAAPLDEPTAVLPAAAPDDTLVLPPGTPPEDPTVVRPPSDAPTVVRPPSDAPTVVRPGLWGEGATLIHYPPPPLGPPPAPPGGGSSWTRGPWRFLIALVGVAAIAAGVILIVSHSKGKTTSTRTLLGRVEFIRRADAICGALNPQVQADYEIALADSNAGNVAGAQVEIAKLERAAALLIDQIRGLGPPAQDAAAVTAFLGEYSELVADAVADTPESNAAADALQTQIAAGAAQFGFRVCGRT